MRAWALQPGPRRSDKCELPLLQPRGSQPPKGGGGSGAAGDAFGAAQRAVQACVALQLLFLMNGRRAARGRSAARGASRAVHAAPAAAQEEHRAQAAADERADAETAPGGGLSQRAAALRARVRRERRHAGHAEQVVHDRVRRREAARPRPHEGRPPQVLGAHVDDVRRAGRGRERVQSPTRRLGEEQDGRGVGSVGGGVVLDGAAGRRAERYNARNRTERQEIYIRDWTDLYKLIPCELRWSLELPWSCRCVERVRGRGSFRSVLANSGSVSACHE